MLRGGTRYPIMVIRKLHTLHAFSLLKALLSADLSELSAEYSQNSSDSQCSFRSEAIGQVCVVVVVVGQYLKADSYGNPQDFLRSQWQQFRQWQSGFLFRICHADSENSSDSSDSESVLAQVPKILPRWVMAKGEKSTVGIGRRVVYSLMLRCGGPRDLPATGKTIISGR